MKTRMIALALSLTIAAAPAAAAPVAGHDSSEVRIDDLNLNAPRDQQRLETRIKSAARKLCSTGMRGTAERARQIECMSGAIAAAQPQADRAIARAGHGAKGGQLALLLLQDIR